ncbi:hypothetical protein QBC46DRAFT_452850 [Diplogelasinospora grovesii]|uniref:Uncharacterized protein n=1 Tax=Diplogelasinospora grovesii TaxID=303347 RepID=A0AAN6S1E6_9PEZI|nr:hypothetical protein QBC46DRAFT_452850 [Diplogelasinospora grovesii]
MGWARLSLLPLALPSPQATVLRRGRNDKPSPKGQKDTQFDQGEQIGKFSRGSCFLTALSATLYASLGVHMQQEGRERVFVDQAGFDWRHENPLHIQTISSIKFILRGQYKRRDGTHL